MSEPKQGFGRSMRTRRGNNTWSDVVSSSRQVWLAGLGALAEAQAKGAKALDALVERGREVERRLAHEAEVGRSRSRAGGPPRPTEKLGLLFEQRVARAVDRLGLRPTVDVAKLAARVERLSARVEQLSKQLAASEAAAKPKRSESGGS
jgi:poly(hydroxyalkanoate) granule-associated protein